MHNSLLNEAIVFAVVLYRPISPLSDGGIGGSDGEGIHSPSRKKKKKLEEETSSKKDSFDQVCNRDGQITCNDQYRRLLLNKAMKTCLKISLPITHLLLIILMISEGQFPRR